MAEGRQGAARLDRATADLAEALEGAEVVIAPLPATSHADLARRLVGRLTGKEIVLFTPGTLGSYAVARDLARAGGPLPFAFAESGTLPYLTRKTGPAAVSAPVRAANLPVGVFPASRSKVALERITALFPATRPCVDALDAALTNAGPVIHPPLVLVNAASIDGGTLRHPRRRHHGQRAPDHRRGRRRAHRRPPGLGLPGAPLRAGHLLRRGARGGRTLRRRRQAEAGGERPLARGPDATSTAT